MTLRFQNFTSPGFMEQATYVLITVGAFMFLVSFLGYCGALKESQCMLTLVSINLNVFFLFVGSHKVIL